MRTTLFISIAAVLGSTIVMPVHAENPEATSCFRRDLDATIAIEQHGAANDVSPEELYKASIDQVAARRFCNAGEANKAIGLYERIVSIGTASPGNK